MDIKHLSDMTFHSMFLPRLASGVIFAGGLCVLSACGNMQSQPEVSAGETQRGPVMLAPKRSADSEGAQASYAGAVDPAELGKAIERYRLSKKREVSPYETGVADLNGDGRPEAVVLFTGQDWCIKTGCSLVVFQAQEFGFRPVSHTVSVRPPVLAASAQATGWRDLIVKTGGGGAPIRAVTVAFSSNGYAANAIVQPAADSVMATSAASVIKDSPSFQAALDQQQTAGASQPAETRNP